MSRKKKIIIAVVAVMIVGVVLAVAWLLVGASTGGDTTDNKPDSSNNESTENKPTANDIQQKLAEDTNAITNDNKLSNEEKRDKTIEVMEGAKKKYEEIGDADKVTEITANIETVKSLPIDNEQEQTGGDSQPAQPGKEN